MTIRATSVFIAAAAAAMLGLFAENAPAQSPQASTVPVYDSTQIAFNRYSVVRRLGIEGGESAIRIRGYADLESAQRALLAEAARFGADGVINLTCFDKTDRVFHPAGYFCYGNAIKRKN
jgi:hypothetical protein